jgi:hypothetical protein
MHTLFDFITQVKGAEYLIAVSAVGLFLLFWEVLKPRPFKSMVDTAKGDITQIGQSGGFAGVMRTAGHVAAAPFIGLAYVVSLPFVFVYAVGEVLLQGTARAITAGAEWVARTLVLGAQAVARIVYVSPAFSWRPQEAYLLGRKRRQRADKGRKDDKERTDKESSDKERTDKEPAVKDGDAK